MLIRLFNVAIIVSFFSGYLLFSSHNYDYEIRSSCYNSSSESSDPDCYPLWYENSDGSTNAFANFVAVLNYAAPVISITGIKLSHYFIQKWDKEIDRAIEKQLRGIADAEKQVRILLSSVIQGFDNGISEDIDYSLALGLVENLNRYKCKYCINEFVEIVSKHFGEDAMLVSQNKNSDERFANRNEFHKFASKIPKYMRENRCEGHTYQEIDHAPAQEKGITNKVASACLYNWIHPFHWSSLAYTATALVIPPSLAWVVETKNHAGSFIGDMANISNVIVIPTLHAYNIFQNWRNYDRIKAQRLLDEINRRLEGIHGIIEIAGLVIGQMDNHINVSQARGFLKALVLMGSPKVLVESFTEFAARRAKVLLFGCDSFKDAYYSFNSPYSDPDIEAALELQLSNKYTVERKSQQNEDPFNYDKSDEEFCVVDL